MSWSKLLTRDDGPSAYERVKGRNYHGDVLEFATPIFRRLSGKVHGRIMAERWHEGVWLGNCSQINEHHVALSDGKVTRARTIEERPNNMEATMEMLDGITHYPWMTTGALQE